MNGEQRDGGWRLITWLGPEPRRVDVAHVHLDADRLSAHGSSTCANHVLTYRLRTGAAWVTRELDVAVDGDGWCRRLTLRRTQSGHWSARRHESSDAGPETDEPVVLPDLDTALDCDLGLCPLTNTMPILRAGLVEASQRGEARRAELTMAWVSVPDLRVTSSAQVYESGVPVVGGGAQVHFTSEGFAAHIEVDADGLVVSYPSIGRRLPV